MMRTIAIAFIIFSSVNLNAQTSVIGLKSHHGNMAELQYSPDQFGVVPPQKRIDTITKIDDDCIIEMGTETDWGGGNSRHFRDTACGHWYYQQVNYDVDKIRERHHKSIVLLGFEDNIETSESDKKDEVDGEKKSRKRKKPKKNKRPRWLFFPLIFIAFGTPISQTRKS